MLKRRVLLRANLGFAVLFFALGVLCFPGSVGLPASTAEASGTGILGSLEIGDKVVDPSWVWEHRTGSDYSATGVTKPVTWIVVAKNHYGSNSGVTLLSEELIGLFAFDNSTDRKGFYDTPSPWGLPHWGDSGTGNATRGLRPWLNSTGIHSSEGFYNAFSASFKSAIVPVTIPNKFIGPNNLTDYYYTTEDRVFIPTNTELGMELQDRWEIGTAYPYFFNAMIFDRIAQLEGSAKGYWCRTPAMNFHDVYGICYAGHLLSSYASNLGTGYAGAVRPALNLRSLTPVSASPNADGVYEIAHGPVHNISANINTHSITPDNPKVGDEITLQMNFTNTGDFAHTFIAGGNIRMPGQVLPQSFERSVTLSPGQSRTESWTFTADKTGVWHYQFVVWKGKPLNDDNSLHKSPVPMGSFTVEDADLPPEGEGYISRISPSTATPYCEVTLQGNFPESLIFYDTPWIYFGQREAEILSYSPTEIIVRAPKPRQNLFGETIDPVVEVALYNGDINMGGTPISNKVVFTYIDAELPVINFISPSSGTPKTTVNIGGRHFSDRSYDDEAFIKFGNSFFQEQSWAANYFGTGLYLDWQEDEITVKPPADYGTGISSYNAVFTMFTLAKKTAKEFLMNTSLMLLSEHFEEPTLLEIDLNAGDSPLKWYGAIIGKLILPGVDVKLNGEIEVDVVVRTIGGRSEPATFTYTEQADVNVAPFLFSKLCSPGEIRIYDAQGRVTGLVNGTVKEEIPNSFYFEDEKIIIVTEPGDHNTYRYEVKGTHSGEYSLFIGSLSDDDAAQAVRIADVTTSSNDNHRFVVDWEALLDGEEGSITIEGMADDVITVSPPMVPHNPSPSNQNEDITLDAKLSWNASLFETEQEVMYRVYFGTQRSPAYLDTIGPFKSSDDDFSYAIESLEEDTTYFWRIVAVNNHGLTAESPVWSFTTQSKLGQKVLYVQNQTTGAVRAWNVDVDPTNVENSMIKDKIVIGNAPAPQADWRIAAVHDIDGSGSPDLIWHNSATGQRRVWKMDGFDKALELNYGAQDRPNLVIADLHDMDGDGKPDAILQNPAGGRFFWFMDGHLKRFPRNIPGAGPNWNITGVDDMGADGKTNIIWEHNLVGGRNYWTLNDQYERIRAESGRFFTTGPQWKIVAVHDMDGDGNPDIIWEHRGTGDRSIWCIDTWPPPDPDEVELEDWIDARRRGSFSQEPVSWKIVGAGTLSTVKGANADLSALSVSPGSLSPSFTAGITVYTVGVGHDTASINITATLTAAAASLTINGQPTSSGVSRNVSLNAAGQSTAIKVVVTAADGTTTKTYNVTVNRAAEPPPDLGITMVQVGEPGVTYTIPTGTDDANTAQVAGGYQISATQVTYELWYEVRVWAEANGYYFKNRGMEGSVTGGGWPYHNIGKPPTSAKNEPVTMVNWRDCLVWLNAFSEKYGLAPVYRTNSGNVIRDSRDSNAELVDDAVQTGHNGYRLPTSMEWEMAARWKNDTASTHGSIWRGNRWWTPGNYASGATAPYTNAAATRAVAWYWANSDTGQGEKTQPVGLKNPNPLGLYDMSGNVQEWCFNWHPQYIGLRRVMRGGGWFNYLAEALQVGVMEGSAPSVLYHSGGFRLARTP